MTTKLITYTISNDRIEKYLKSIDKIHVSIGGAGGGAIQGGGFSLLPGGDGKFL